MGEVNKAVPVSVDGSLLSSLSSSTESSFRELDDVFLQSQAKIWIGEILQIRLSEELHIADLLADGELLYEVSREIWSLLATKRMELRGLRSHRYDPFVSRKSGGRYRPYSNVDMFLKVCKILGLVGIDLFSPSDVVEKRNTRKVCMCIRSLSKKVRSRQLNVPDFDIVTYTVAMPTDMVGCIRRSWEMSHCSPSSSAASSSRGSLLNSRQLRRQNQSLAYSERTDDLYNEESDDTESDLMLRSDSQTSSFSYDTSSFQNYESLDYQEVSSVRKDLSCEQCSSLLNIQTREEDECDKCCCESESVYKSRESFPSQSLECDHQELSTSFPSYDSSARFGTRAPQSLDMGGIDSNIDDNGSVVGDSDGNTPTRNKFGGESDLSIFVFDGAYKNNDTLLHGEDDNFHACANTGSRSSENISPVNLDNGCRSRTSDVDHTEASSVASLSSTSDAVQKLDANDQVNARKYFRNLASDKASFRKLDSGNNCMKESKFPEKIADETPERGLTASDSNGCLDSVPSDNIIVSRMDSAVCEVRKSLINDHSQVCFHQWDVKGKCRVSSPSTMNDNPSEVDFQKGFMIQTKATEIALSHDEKKFDASSKDATVQSNISSESDTSLETETLSVNEYIQNVGKISDQVSKTCENDCIQADDAYELCCDDYENENFRDLAANEEKSDDTQHRRLVIKSVASGTAVLGAVLLFIHLRKNGGQKTGKSDKRSIQTRKADISTQNRRKGNNGVYPSEKLKFS